METKERENTNTRPRSANAGKRVERLKMNFGVKTYDNQFTFIIQQKVICICEGLHSGIIVLGRS